MNNFQPIIDSLNVISSTIYIEAVAMTHYKGVVDLSFCAVFALLIILHATIFQRKILTFLDGDFDCMEKWVLIIVIYLILALFFLGTLFDGINQIYFTHCEALKYLLH